MVMGVMAALRFSGYNDMVYFPRASALMQRSCTIKPAIDNDVHTKISIDRHPCLDLEKLISR